MAYPSDRIRFTNVDGVHATGCEQAYLDGYYVGRIWEEPDGWFVDLREASMRGLPNADEAREVMRMWIDRNYDATVKRREEYQARERLRGQRRAEREARHERRP